MTQKTGPRSGPVTLKAKALQWLAQREHSRGELARKLQRWQASQDRSSSPPPLEPEDAAEIQDPIGQGREREPALDRKKGEFSHSQLPTSSDPAERAAAVQATLDDLARAGLLSDLRFSESRVRQRQQRYGNRRIEQELRHHGVRATPEQWTELRNSESERALSVLRSRFKTAEEGRLDLKHLQRGQRFLTGRGFSSDAIRAALRQWARRVPEDNT